MSASVLSNERIAAVGRAIFADDSRITGAYLFGSRATGEEHPKSDVDIGVLFRDKVGLDSQVRLEARLESALGASVDLVDIGRCNAFLALDAIRGQRIYEADPLACDEFDLYVMRRAGDLAPFERERRRMISEHARAGARGTR